MELTNTPMCEKQRNYRRIYRERIAGWYNGWLHVSVVYCIGAAALYIYTSHIKGVALWEWLAIPAVAFFCNVFEWFLHRHVMHRPLKGPGLRPIYTRHTLMHHQFFTDTEMRFADSLDWRVTFFPPFALVTFILMSAVGGAALGWLISPNVGWLVMFTTTCIYMLYEFMHFCCHVEENWFVRNCPFVNTMRRHHTAHHDQSLMMELNMNLTFPISDWLFGTSDLDRGLFGHLFNGYSTKYLKKNLRKSSTTPKPSASRKNRGGREAIV